MGHLTAARLLAAQLLLAVLYIACDTAITADMGIAEAVGYGAFCVALEGLFVTLVWRRHRWAWTLLAWLMPFGILLLAACFVEPRVLDYPDPAPVLGLSVLMAIALAQFALWFRPELRAHIAGRPKPAQL